MLRAIDGSSATSLRRSITSRLRPRVASIAYLVVASYDLVAEVIGQGGILLIPLMLGAAVMVSVQ
jgi:hypothetical protein